MVHLQSTFTALGRVAVQRLMQNPMLQERQPLFQLGFQVKIQSHHIVPHRFNSNYPASRKTRVGALSESFQKVASFQEGKHNPDAFGRVLQGKEVGGIRDIVIVDLEQ